MNRSSWVIPVVIALLVAGVFFAGCSDESTPAGDTTAPSSTPTVAASSGPLYSEGDIVKNPSSSLSNGLLIVSYDATSDMYERATVYPNRDGSWGYRIDSKTSKISRANLEKAYTEKVTTVSVSSITIGAPTTATTAPTTTTTVVTTATTSAAYAPKIKDITPDYGVTGKKVDIDELEGSNFASGAKVLLKKSGETSLTATDVEVESSTVISCSFTIPSDAETGYWDVVVTNADGQSDTYETGFTITKGNTTSTTSTTTTTTTSVAVTIYSLSPSSQYIGGAAHPGLVVDISGSNLGAGNKVTLTYGGSTITSTSYSALSTTSARATFDIPAGSSAGAWTVRILDSSSNTLGTLENGFTMI